MDFTQFVPTDVPSLKRLAKHIHENKPSTWHEALDAASLRAGKRNYRHFRNDLTLPIRPAAPLPTILISVYWRDGMHSGRETFSFECAVDLKKFNINNFSYIREFKHFRIDAEDHIESKVDYSGQYQAQNAVMAAARALEFVSITSLLPANRDKLFKNFGSIVSRLPQCDHTTLWRLGNSPIAIDEPYGCDDDLREEWAVQTSMTVARSGWPSVYNPGADHFIVGDSESVARVQRCLRVAKSKVPRHWAGTSHAYNPTFVSPRRAELNTKKRGRLAPVYSGMVKNKAIAYLPWFPFSSPAWKPDGVLAKETHHEIYRLLCSVETALNIKDSCKMKYSLVRGELRNWAESEHRDWKSKNLVAKIHEIDLDALNFKLRDLLGGYPNCQPLERLFKSAERAKVNGYRKRTMRPNVVT